MSRRRSVQQQNADAMAEIQGIADLFRSEPLSFAWLRTILRNYGLDDQHGALVRLAQTPAQEGTLMSGVWATSSHEFWEFAVMLSRDPSEVLEVEQFRNVTSESIISPSTPGTGKSFSYLACEVLAHKFDA